MVSASEVPNETPPRRTVLAGLTLLLGLGPVLPPACQLSAICSVRCESHELCGLRRAGQHISSRRDTAAHLRQSAPTAVGRHRGAHRRLRSLPGRPISGTSISSEFSRSIARTWAARSRGFHSRDCSCALATAVCITKRRPRIGATTARPLSLRLARAGGRLKIRAPHFPTLHDTLEQSAMPDPSNKAGDRA